MMNGEQAGPSPPNLCPLFIIHHSYFRISYPNSPGITLPWRTIITGRPVLVWYSLW